MNWKDYSNMKIPNDLLNTIDRNMHKSGENYWKYGANKRKFPSKFRAFYVNIMMHCPDTGDQKKHIMSAKDTTASAHVPYGVKNN